MTSPETAAELGGEVFASYAPPSVYEQWGMKEIEGKGMGLFAKRKIEAGESVILESPVLVISREVLGSVSRGRRSALLERAVGQLPEKTRR